MLLLLNQAWVHLPATQQSQSSDTRMWWRKGSIYYRCQARRMGSLWSKDAKSPATFRARLLFIPCVFFFVLVLCLSTRDLRSSAITGHLLFIIVMGSHPIPFIIIAPMSTLLFSANPSIPRLFVPTFPHYIQFFQHLAGKTKLWPLSIAISLQKSYTILILSIRRT